MGDKDIEGMLTLMEPHFDAIVISKNSSHRASDIERLGELARNQFGPSRVILEADLKGAVAKAIEWARAESGAVIVTGSVVTVGEARRILRETGGQ